MLRNILNNNKSFDLEPWLFKGNWIEHFEVNQKGS